MKVHMWAAVGLSLFATGLSIAAFAIALVALLQYHN